ncbi:high-affinity branched-chain amino acid ABC transporter permease LivM [Plesiomonas shigelloides]|uniref:high-affinity branched-chain amino acid ABC transporter permease LivM n=1 Tax=Plesiomonas shigelloides TaxID=703 RepID=UPI00126238DF|nr:high-affinity branched-chain amino acid ABC transporter permease LivM [Plesiomonas shigelloides]KAB7713448.1 high-affinity branched-chain amino acid ABC transporter permease LivM [Plesiomonas shigelloides]
MKRTFMHALLSAGMLVVLTFMLMGLRLTNEGGQVIVSGAEPAQVRWIFLGAALVFVVQLLRPWLSGYCQRAKQRLPVVELPALDLSRHPQRSRFWLMLVLGLALLFPFLVSRSAVDIATLTLIYVMLGLGLNVVVGLAGLLDLGYVGFYAVGAYSYALLNSYLGFSFWEALPIAGLLAALFGFLLGFPVLRLRGDYLAIVTLGFGEIIRILLLNLTEITGGPNGIGQIPKPTLFGLEFNRTVKDGGWETFHQFFGLPYSGDSKVIFLYLMALLLVLLTLLVVYRLLRMPLGRAWEALREDEIACRSLGLNPTIIKLTAFTIGATFAGFAGSFFAARQGFISPESFTFIESAIILAIVVLGGMGSQVGVILAAVVMTVLPELARQFDEYRMLLFGLMMVLMMVWRPQGLLPMQRPHLSLPDSPEEPQAASRAVGEQA